MSDLIDLRDHARTRAQWQPGLRRIACKTSTGLGTPKHADHANCGGHRCGCDCHQPTSAERHMWTQIADEIDAYLAGDLEDSAPSPDQEALWP